MRQAEEMFDDIPQKKQHLVKSIIDEVKDDETGYTMTQSILQNIVEAPKLHRTGTFTTPRKQALNGGTGDTLKRRKRAER